MWFFRFVAAFAAVVALVTGLGTIVGWMSSSDVGQDVAAMTVQIAGAVFLILCLPGLLGVLAATRTPWERIAVGVPVGVFIAVTAALIVPWRETPLQWLGITGLGVALWIALVDIRYRLTRHAASRKICPDCVETIKVEANVCRYCGYRFAPAPISRSD